MDPPRLHKLQEDNHERHYVDKKDEYMRVYIFMRVVLHAIGTIAVATEQKRKTPVSIISEMTIAFIFA